MLGEHNLKPLLLFTKEALIGRVLWVISQLYPTYIRMISLLLTLVLSFALHVINTHPHFASDSCNNKDIILILGYNYNLFTRI